MELMIGDLRFSEIRTEVDIRDPGPHVDIDLSEPQDQTVKNTSAICTLNFGDAGNDQVNLKIKETEIERRFRMSMSDQAGFLIGSERL